MLHCLRHLGFTLHWQAITLPPRLREWMLGDDVKEDGSSSSSGGGDFSSRKDSVISEELLGVRGLCTTH